MDTITHSLLGAVVVRSVFPAYTSKCPLSNRQRLVTGAIAGAFPDVDYVASWVDPMVYLTLWHRGITHSFVMLPLWALLVGIALSLVFRQRAEWRYISLLAGVSVLLHILSDLITVYGTQIFAPLSHWRASIGTTFIIDPWFTLIVLIGFTSGMRDKVQTLPRISLVVLVGYIAFQAVLKQQALSIAHQHIQQKEINGAIATVLPQPFSPFNWKIIISADDRYEVSYVNLAGGYSTEGDGKGFRAQVKQTYQSQQNLSWRTHFRYGNDPGAVNWVRLVWENSQLDYFRRFAEFPALHRIDRNIHKTCVWFTDIRYVVPYMTPLFRYGLCSDTGASDWHLNRLRQSGHTH